MTWLLFIGFALFKNMLNVYVFRVVFIRPNTIYHTVHSSLLLYRLEYWKCCKNLCNSKGEGEREREEKATHTRVWNSNVVNINMPLRIGTVHCYAWNFQLHFEIWVLEKEFISLIFIHKMWSRSHLFSFCSVFRWRFISHKNNNNMNSEHKTSTLQ